MDNLLIERLRALEKKERDLSARAVDYNGDEWNVQVRENKMHRAFADELATILADLGQEVGAVAWNGLTKDEVAQYVGQISDYGTGFVSPLFAVVENIEKTLKTRNTSPAHTSEARDAARLDWLEKHGCWQFAGPSESDIRGPAYRWFDYDTDGHDYSETLREAIDAAMRQEGGNG